MAEAIFGLTLVETSWCTYRGLPSCLASLVGVGVGLICVFVFFLSGSGLNCARLHG